MAIYSCLIVIIIATVVLCDHNHDINPNVKIDNKYKISWFTNAGYIDYNYEFYKNNSGIITEYYPCCMSFLVGDKGNFIQSYPDDEVYAFTVPYLKLNVGVLPVITCNNATNMYKAYDNPYNFIYDAISVIKKFNFTGYIFDYEASDDNATLYAEFLDTFANELHKINKTLGVCLASWGILSRYDVFGKTNIDVFMNMATYNPTDMTYMYTKWLVNNVTVPTKAVNGIANPSAPSIRFKRFNNRLNKLDNRLNKMDDKWTNKTLTKYLNYVKSYKMNHIAIWWCPNTIKDGFIPQFFADALMQFIHSDDLSKKELAN
jgi:hypothetical protein